MPITARNGNDGMTTRRSDLRRLARITQTSRLRSLDGRRPLPKSTKLLVLAYQIEQAIDEGRAKDYVDVAQRLGVTRARITQVMNLLLLAPEIQATILVEPHRVHRLSEHQLRLITEEPEWKRQTDMFRELLDTAKAESILD